MQQDVTGKCVETFKNLTTMDHRDVETLSSFLCNMYGQKHVADVNDSRHAVFQLMTGRITQDNLLANVKRIDGATPPPVCLDSSGEDSVCSPCEHPVGIPNLGKATCCVHAPTP